MCVFSKTPGGRVKTGDCGSCACPHSANAGQHHYQSTEQVLFGRQLRKCRGCGQYE